ncbi:helix-turn-helix domain-containing protein [Streptomyces sp. ZAF1911]|uniref:helix-turn-helix domain-containing protein n=1 Tax=Streptomyces sp. ZAF1911 TaxID=2944129 RepID=UPI00237B834D|nr:helix-turn-helix domain-containing protein [Streptomyces sp. ZAF1911]MDD9377024.1 helix-turn-helix domain-containing protein [Streptomyces sp. ZAF1911]
MASVHFTAPTRATYGVRHANVRLTGRFTVVSNDLIQHPEMSFIARMLGIFIQSMPPGTPIGIKDLAKRLSIGEISIGKALRELVRFGYLERSLESLPGGRIATRTVSFNHPRAAAMARCRTGRAAPAAHPAPAAPSDEAPPAPPVSDPVEEPPVEDAPVATPPEAVPEPESEPESQPEPQPDAPARRLPGPRDSGNPGRRRLACEVLAELRRVDARLLLGERDIRYLAGGVEAWLERGAGVEALVTALSARLPDGLRNPAGLIAHRLTAQLPPPLVPLPRAPAFVAPDPFVNCTECDLAFRSPTPGKCKGCRG